MDGYPALYTEINVPLVFLSGLGTQSDIDPSPVLGQGFRIATPLPALQEHQAGPLRGAFERLSHDGSSATERPDQSVKVVCIGREYTYPARKAAPAAQTSSGSPPRSPTSPSGSGNPFELHSPLSPLSSVSPLFPNGLMTPHWLSKHKYHVPTVIVYFVELPLQDQGDADAQLKAEINALKASLARSGFRTRLAVVIVNDGNTLQLEDRLSGIRRATGLDPKTSFFYFAHPSSDRDRAAFAEALITALRPVHLDCYRELTKHARRKRGRGFLPVTTSTSSKALSTASWNARYDFKMGVFAEFRAEWETAEKQHLSALDNLFTDSDGALGSKAHHHAETVLFADITAIRALRCQLWRGATSTAAAFWAKHKSRIQGLRPIGNDTAFHDQIAWESRWAAIMAELVQNATLPIFDIHPSHTDLLDLNEDDESRKERQAKTGQTPQNAVFAPLDVLGPQDRPNPWHYLHHPGYWYALAASRCFDHSQNVSRALELNNIAIESLISRQQQRASARLALRQARILLKNDRKNEAGALLHGLWHHGTWRADHWWSLYEQTIALVRQSEAFATNPTLQAECDIEAMCSVINVATPDAIGAEPPLMSNSSRLIPLSITAAFANVRGHVGDTTPCQITIIPQTPTSTKLELRTVILEFHNGNDITIEHEQQRAPSQTQAVRFNSAETGVADLSLSSQPLVLNLSIPLSRVGDLIVRQVQSIVSLLGTNATFVHTRGLHSSNWWLATQDGLKVRDRRRPKSTHIHVLPKLPRVQIRLPTIKEQYYTDELIQLDVELVNEENTAIDGHFKVEIVERPSDDPLALTWGTDTAATSRPSPTSISREVESLPIDHSHRYQVRFDAPRRASAVKLAMTIDYRLSSDPQQPCTRTLNLDMTFLSPFEMALTLLPRHDTADWPDFFALPNSIGERTATGIPHSWVLDATVTNPRAEAIHVDSAELINNESSSNLLCTFGEPELAAGLLEPQTSSVLRFPFATQVKRLESRSPDADISVAIKWRRQSEPGPVATTVVQVPRYLVPPIEPRVLCTSSRSTDSMAIKLTLENPSTHFLTFDASLDAGRTFGFGGPKRKSLSLTPMSRVDLEYRLYPYSDQASSGGRWHSLKFVVVDAYYHKTLKVLAAGQDVRNTSQSDIEVFVPSIP